MKRNEIRIVLLLALMVCGAGTSRGSEHSLDPRLGQRAIEYFHALELGDYRRLWGYSSTRLRAEAGGNIEDYVAHLQENVPYELSVEVLVGWSEGNKGEVFVRIHTRNTKADEPEVTEYISRWVLNDGTWALDDFVNMPFDDLVESPFYGDVFKELPRVGSSPN
jgi:hypothetical protein